MPDSAQPDRRSVQHVLQRTAGERVTGGWRRFGGIAIGVSIMLATLVLNQLSYALTLWALRISVWAIPAIGLFLLLEVALIIFLWERAASVARGLLWGVVLSIGLQFLLLTSAILSMS